MIRKTTDVNQLAIWCSVYKKELDRKRFECKEIFEELKLRKKEIEILRSEVNNHAIELKAAKDQIRSLDEKMLNQGQQFVSLQQKILLEVCILSRFSLSSSLLYS